MDLNRDEVGFEPPPCSICLDLLCDNLAFTRCGHVFHMPWYSAHSLDLSLTTRSECPNCREQVASGDVVKVSFSVSKALTLASAHNFSSAEVKLLEAKLEEVSDHNTKLEHDLQDFSDILKVATKDNEALRVRSTQENLREANHELNYLKQRQEINESMISQANEWQSKVRDCEWRQKVAESALSQQTAELESERATRQQLETHIRELERTQAQSESKSESTKEMPPKGTKTKNTECSVGQKRVRELTVPFPEAASEDKPKRIKPVSKQKKG